jgi:hypothetical protein
MQQLRIEAGRQTGSPFAAGNYEVIPEAIVLSIRWGNMGFVWNWPVALTVNHAGRAERVAIVDPTRVVLWGLWLLTAWAGLMALFALLKPRRRKDG